MAVVLEEDLARLLHDNPDLRRLNPDIAVESAAKPSKYRNQPTAYRGRIYHSAKEARRAERLDIEVRAGEIVAWFPQVRIPVARGIVYVADFVVLHNDLTIHVEDTKGIRTKDYKLKAKLFEERYGQKIAEG